MSYNEYRKKLGYSVLDTLPYDEFFYSKCKPAVLTFAWMPKRCHISGKRIWLKYGYKLTATWRAGDIDFVSEHRWHDRDSHILWRLKR